MSLVEASEGLISIISPFVFHLNSGPSIIFETNSDSKIWINVSNLELKGILTVNKINTNTDQEVC